MIYTLTLNPSLDYIVFTDVLRKGEINRSKSDTIFAGGKGINVSIVLANLGMESTALGFVGGFTGNEIRRELLKRDIKTDFVEVEGNSRVNVKVKAEEETEINGMGPKITEEDLALLMKKIDEIKDGDYLVMSGSVPKSIPEDIYEKIMERLSGKDVKIVVDAERDLLLKTLRYHPFLIKPNDHELSEIFHTKIDNALTAYTYAKKLQESGARNVLVSRGKEGAVLATEDGKAYIFGAPEGKTINSTGAGDSMVAGFIYGYLSQNSYVSAFRFGLCAGSATAFREGLAESEDVMDLYYSLKEKYGWK